MTHFALAKELNGIIRIALAENASALADAGSACRHSLLGGGQILAFGNGGSAAEAQHFVAELVNKFSAPRPALRAVSLTTDTSVLTSIGNDLSFAAIFGRQVEALGRAGDIALALSTSGSSPNVVRGLAVARKRGLITIGMMGARGGKMGPLCDFLLRVPSPSTPRVQEVHLILLHLLVSEIEGLRDRPTLA
jgi:D-sedoheptulose 7-phosphate isomerase